MIPSVSPEADRELSDSSIFYAREANAEVGLAFILEYERALALLCANPNLGAPSFGHPGKSSSAAMPKPELPC